MTTSLETVLKVIYRSLHVKFVSRNGSKCSSDVANLISYSGAASKSGFHRSTGFIHVHLHTCTSLKSAASSEQVPSYGKGWTGLSAEDFFVFVFQNAFWNVHFVIFHCAEMQSAFQSAVALFFLRYKKGKKHLILLETFEDSKVFPLCSGFLWPVSMSSLKGKDLPEFAAQQLLKGSFKLQVPRKNMQHIRPLFTPAIPSKHKKQIPFVQTCMCRDLVTGRNSENFVP